MFDSSIIFYYRNRIEQLANTEDGKKNEKSRKRRRRRIHRLSIKHIECYLHRTFEVNWIDDTITSHTQKGEKWREGKDETVYRLNLSSVVFTYHRVLSELN